MVMKELTKNELMGVEGGNQPVATYLTQKQIEAAGEAIMRVYRIYLDYVVSIFKL
jgi:bacteriocin-like protein